MKFSIKGFFSKCNQIRSFLRIWSHLLKKSLMENFIAVNQAQLMINNFRKAIMTHLQFLTKFRKKRLIKAYTGNKEIFV